MILNNEGISYISYKFKPGDFKTKRLIIEVEYYVEVDGRKIEGDRNKGLTTIQGFIVEKFENFNLYIKTTENVKQ